jgi:hypothetical protein
MVKVVSIHNEIVKLRQLGLLDAKVNDQSRIDEILRSMIHSFLRNLDVSIKEKMFALRLNW